jgi:hypothetical protein
VLRAVQSASKENLGGVSVMAKNRRYLCAVVCSSPQSEECVPTVALLLLLPTVCGQPMR